jgi:nitrate/TMAO reductase-like tetraheme cytochrome c subunit
MSTSVRLIRAPIAIVGMVLTTISASLFLVVFLADLFGWHSNPYVGIVFFLILPALFLLGLALIPLGAWVERRRRARGRGPSDWPRFDLNDPKQRYTAVIIFLLTIANVVIVSLAAYRGVEYMDSPQFCGQTCHTVMKPEWTAYQDGPHSRVSCVQCHVGPGASGFARAKLSGTRQLLAVTFHTYPRPIGAPVRNLRPATETCEQCHWPEKFHGDKIRRVAEYASDEKNTETITTLQVHVGGGNDRLGTAQGIHWHMNVGNQVEYIATDDKRDVIPWVRVTDRAGNVREYATAGVTPEQLAKGERRRMDCMDCHNRPSHLNAATPVRAVDEMIASAVTSRPTGKPSLRFDMIPNSRMSDVGFPAKGRSPTHLGARRRPAIGSCGRFRSLARSPCRFSTCDRRRGSGNSQANRRARCCLDTCRIARSSRETRCAGKSS